MLLLRDGVLPPRRARGRTARGRSEGRGSRHDRTPGERAPELRPVDSVPGAVHEEADVNGVRLHYVTAGKGPLVVLLHGFPELWYAWRLQIPALAAAGFRVAAPDMRGYNLSSKPAGVPSYRINRLTGDVAALIRHLGEERAHVVGHDWGGGVAWNVPRHHPEVVDRLVILNSPHKRALVRELKTLSQMRKSWYMLFFQLPVLPEANIRAFDYALVRRILRKDPVRKDAFTEEDIDAYVKALDQPGALTAAINYYRALPLGEEPGSAKSRNVECPTLVIWGEQDSYLGVKLTEGLEEWVPRVRVERIPDASHWVQADAPDLVNRLMIDFLREA
jgi:pimeloyl-ACP methyl ester carboxylesterase